MKNKIFSLKGEFSRVKKQIESFARQCDFPIYKGDVQVDSYVPAQRVLDVIKDVVYETDLVVRMPFFLGIDRIYCIDGNIGSYIKTLDAKKVTISLSSVHSRHPGEVIYKINGHRFFYSDFGKVVFEKKEDALHVLQTESDYMSAQQILDFALAANMSCGMVKFKHDNGKTFVVADAEYGIFSNDSCLMDLDELERQYENEEVFRILPIQPVDIPF